MNDKFTYEYSAPTKAERNEIEDIKRRYSTVNGTFDKLSRLRNLDKKVKNPPVIISLTLGIVGTLIFGLGLTMVLEWQILVWGIIVMLIGCAPMVAAYFAYNYVLNKNKSKYSKEILRLSDELLSKDE